MWNGRLRESRPRSEWRSLRQRGGVHFPAPEGLPADPRRITSSRAGPHPADRARRSRASPARPGRSAPISTSSTTASAARPAARRAAFRNEPIRQCCPPQRLTDYRRFGALFPVARRGTSPSIMFARAIAEFEFTLAFADAPIEPVRARRKRGA